MSFGTRRLLHPIKTSHTWCQHLNLDFLSTKHFGSHAKNWNKSHKDFEDFYFRSDLLSSPKIIKTEDLLFNFTALTAIETKIEKLYRNWRYYLVRKSYWNLSTRLILSAWGNFPRLHPLAGQSFSYLHMEAHFSSKVHCIQNQKQWKRYSTNFGSVLLIDHCKNIRLIVKDDVTWKSDANYSTNDKFCFLFPYADVFISTFWLLLLMRTSFWELMYMYIIHISLGGFKRWTSKIQNIQKSQTDSRDGIVR